MVSQCTKYEVSWFTRYEAVDGGAKCRKWGGLGWLVGTQEVADFDPPHLYLAPPQGVTPVEFRGDLWHQKTRVPGLSCGVVCVILRLAVLVELRLVADTDRRTDTCPWQVPRMHSIAR